MKIDFKIQNCKYNARKMDKKVKARLKSSIEEFGDISGITINKKTGNIFTGNHRWKQLDETYGALELVHQKDDIYLINKKGKYLGFTARVVDWDLTKEKQANIVANSSLVAGDFTEDLQAQLAEINEQTEEALMSDLGLSDIMIDFDKDNDSELDMDETKTDLKRRKTVEDLNQDDQDVAEPVNHIISSIKITSPSEYKEEIMEVVLKALSKKSFYDEITIS